MSTAECPFCRKLASLDTLAREDLVWGFPHSVAFLGPWQYYRGYSLLVSRRHATELTQLTPAESRAYLDEMCILAAAIEACCRPRKLNYELLGNQVPHLHWHLFPRSADDPNTLKPVWLALDRTERSEEERRRLEGAPSERAVTIAALRAKLRELATTR
jgi:diadenosine tetraphosphate (Ap4A) HIT family hydrolase